MNALSVTDGPIELVAMADVFPEKMENSYKGIEAKIERENLPGKLNVPEDQKFIGFDPDIPTRKAVDQIFREHKIEIEPVMEFDNIETVKRAAQTRAVPTETCTASLMPRIVIGGVSSPVFTPSCP